MTYILKVAGRSHRSPCFISELELELIEASKHPELGHVRCAYRAPRTWHASRLEQAARFKS